MSSVYNIINVIAPYIRPIIAGIIASIIVALILYAFNKRIHRHFLRFYFWITNKDVRLSEFDLIMFYEGEFKIDALESIKKTFINDGFEITFINAYYFILKNIFSYELKISKDLISSDPELENFQYSIDLKPMVNVVSYRSALNELVDEMIYITQKLSSLGESPEYYIRIKLKGKEERIKIEKTTEIAKEVRAGATGISKVSRKTAAY